MNQPSKKWTIDAPWGKIALISWGKPTSPPVLLAHGRADSMAAYYPLMELLPMDYYYVGFDLPGHGLSEPFANGIVLTRIEFTVAIEMVVNHLNWDSFAFMGHSMGSEIGIFYNAIYPNKVNKFIHLDVGPGIIRNLDIPIVDYFRDYYTEFYDNYDKYVKDVKVYNKRQALDSVMRAREINESQAEMILSRNLVPVGEDRYRLVWERRLHTVAPLSISVEDFIQIFTLNIPPTLFITASFTQEALFSTLEPFKKITKAMESCKNFYNVIVEGDHNVHFKNPERVAKDIIWFLKRDFVDSKL